MSHENLWLQKDLNQIAINRSGDAVAALGLRLPCHVVALVGRLVTVAFDVTLGVTLPQVTIPQAQSPWVISPTQIGDKGMTITADAYLSAFLGGAIPNMDRPGNLAALVFVPLTGKDSAVVDPNTAYLQGPAGATVRTADDTVSVVVTASGVTINVGSQVVSVTSGGVSVTGSLEVTGDATIGGISFLGHVHGGVQSGSSDTGVPL